MPSLEAGGSGVDVEEAYLTVVLDLEDMAVTTDEEVGRTVDELGIDGTVVMPGVASDVGEQDLGLFTAEAEELGEHATQLSAVAVAYDCSQGTKGSEAVGDLGGADVACVPYLIALCKVLYIAVIPIGVGVAEEADTHGEWGERSLRANRKAHT